MSYWVGLVSAQWLFTLLVMIDLGPLHRLALMLVTLTRVRAIAIMVKLFVVITAINFTSTANGILKILGRTSKMALPTSADHFMLRTYLLEAFLMGSSLLLLLVVSRFCHQAIQIDSLLSDVDVLQKQYQAMHRKYTVLKMENSMPVEREFAKAHEEIGSLKDLVAALRTKMEKLQLESLEKDKVVKAAEANARALQKQSEGFLLEYDRLLDDNENLRGQLVSMDHRLSWSGNKKNA